MSGSDPKRILVYEPRVEGHHLSWLRFVLEDLLSVGCEISLACDARASHQERLRAELGGLLPKTKTLFVINAEGKKMARNHTLMVSKALEMSGMERAFLCNFDEIASDLFRRAAVGILPPSHLAKRLGGIYHRPTFLLKPKAINSRVKRLGFERLLKKGFLNPLLFLDEFLLTDLRRRWPDAPFFHLPVPTPPGLNVRPEEARRQLDLPGDKHIFLFYGGGYRRKGLHLVVDAFEQLSNPRAFLLCAGEMKDPLLQKRLDALESKGRAKVLARYVSTAEEALCVCASDTILLPYIGHLVASGVMSLACGAGRPMIVSDEGLLARRVRQHGLGLLFKSENVPDLMKTIERAANLTTGERTAQVKNVRNFASTSSREVYRRELLASLGLSNASKR